MDELSFSSHDKSGGIGGVDNFFKGFKLIGFNFDNEEVFFLAESGAVDIENGNGEASVTDSGDDSVVAGAGNDLNIEDTFNEDISEDTADIGTGSEAAGVGEGDEQAVFVTVESGANDDKPDEDFDKADSGGAERFTSDGKDHSDGTEGDVEDTAEEDLKAKKKEHKSS